jgi:3-oxoacyl-[acyl-carrier-protein] synthase II
MRKEGNKVNKVQEKIVITGAFSINCYGNSMNNLIQNLENDKKDGLKVHHWVSGERNIPICGYKCNDTWVDSQLEGVPTRSMDRFSKLNVAAMKLAVEEAGIKDDLENTGYIMNTTFGPWESTNQYTIDLVNSGPQNASPRLFPNTVLNSAQGQVAKYFNLKGVSSTITGVPSLLYAYSLIKKGVADRIIVAGAEELNENLIEAYKELGSQVIHGEGVGILIIESEKSANQRNANILAEIVDYEMAHDSGLKRWFEDADPKGDTLKYILSKLESRRSPDSYDDLKCIISGFNGSINIKQAEEIAFKEIYKGRLCNELKILSPKKYLGETFGASCIFNVIIAIGILKNNGEESVIVNHELGGNQVAIRIRKVAMQ